MTERCKCHQENFGQFYGRKASKSWEFSKCLMAKPYVWLKIKANPENSTFVKLTRISSMLIRITFEAFLKLCRPIWILAVGRVKSTKKGLRALYLHTNTWFHDQETKERENGLDALVSNDSGGKRRNHATTNQKTRLSSQGSLYNPWTGNGLKYV